MSLTSFKPQFDNAYQEIFQKVLVGKEICNTRFQTVLSYGQTLERVAYDISGVYVRDTVRGNASTIDAITDSNEVLTVNIEKEAVFYISDGEVKQAGPLNPGETIGAKIGHKVATSLDALIFAEVKNAYQTFDTGDLTTGASTSTAAVPAPITLSSTTVPQMVTRMPAKLKRINIVLANMAFVIDSTAASDLSQYLLGKQFDVVESVWQNGLSGKISTAEVYISENLTGTAVITIGGTPSDADTITIGGVVFTAKTALSSGPAVAGEVVIGGSAAAFITNLVAAINAPGTTTATFTALSAANQAILQQTLGLSAADHTTYVTLVGKGSGRLVISKSGSNITITANYISCYYGKKGAIDLVIQDLKEVDMRQTPDRRGTNVFSSYLAGLKTFADGAKQFLNVMITA